MKSGDAKMMEMRWLLIGGTTEARKAYDYLNRRHVWVMISSATSLGSEMFWGMDCQRHEGRLDEEGFRHLIRENAITHVLDTSHPYAVEVSKTVKAAAKALNLPYYRYTREKTVTDAASPAHAQMIWCDDANEAAAYLNQQTGNIALLTGVNTLKIYAAGIIDFKERVYARVLDTASSRKICEMLWDDDAHYICAKPPFSVEDNLDFLKQADAAYMVTKDSGAAGGMPEKMAAAQETGAQIVIIRRPKETGQLSSLDELEGLFQ